MSEVIGTIEGQIRSVKDLPKKDTGAIFGRSVSILTGAGGVLGETARVTAFVTDHPNGHELRNKIGQTVRWVVSFESSPKYGLRITFKADLDELSSVEADHLLMHQAA